ncbi:MAG: hypothetical protein GC161_05635 [Planctomycetaceae bacterium]|nr:hypothetical protein [Planctomycetaceae bacterium]
MIARTFGGSLGWFLALLGCWLVSAPAARAQGDFELVVLLAENGAPAAGAMLSYQPAGGEPLRGRADAGGRMRLVTPSAPATLEVAFEDRRAVIEVPAGQSVPLVVRLTRPLVVDVVVRGPGGEPAADVPVSLRGAGRMRGRDGFRGAVVRPMELVLAQGRTDAEGRARIEDRGGLFFEPSSVDMDWRLQLDLMAKDAPRLALEAGNVPTAPLELRLPPLGEVVVELTAHDGPVEPGTEIHLSARSDEPLPELVGTSDAEGRVRFSRVGYGLALHLATVDWSAPLPGPDFDGPTAEQPRVTLPWQLPRRPPVLRAQLLDDAGQPLAEGLDLTLRVTWPAGDFLLRGWRVDGDGWMRAELPDALLGVEGAEVEFDVAPAARGNTVSPRRHTQFPLAPLASGPNALGPFQVPPAPLAAAGTVRTRGGEPLAGAELRVVSSLEPTEEPAGPLAGLSGSGGTFELRVPEGGERLFVVVSAPGHRPLRAEVTRGERQWRIELDKEPARR